MMRPTTTKQWINRITLFVYSFDHWRMNRPMINAIVINKIKNKITPNWSNRERLTGCSLYIRRSTGISVVILIVSDGHMTSTRIVSWMRLIFTTAPSRLMWRVIVSRTTNVSTTRRSFVTIVVSTRTMVSLAIVGSFAIARFRCHDAPQDHIIDAVIATTHHLLITPHTNRILRGCQYCMRVVLLFQVHWRNRWMNLPNHCRVWCSLFACWFWIFRKKQGECHADESAEFGQWCFVECNQQCASNKNNKTNDCRLAVFEYSINHTIYFLMCLFSFKDINLTM